MAHMTVYVDDEAEKTLEKLREAFGVKTTGQALSRALALARVATENADDDGKLTIIDRNQERRRIILRA
jgi:hypothetical protein